MGPLSVREDSRTTGPVTVCGGRDWCPTSGRPSGSCRSSTTPCRPTRHLVSVLRILDTSGAPGVLIPDPVRERRSGCLCVGVPVSDPKGAETPGCEWGPSRPRYICLQLLVPASLSFSYPSSIPPLLGGTGTGARTHTNLFRSSTYGTRAPSVSSGVPTSSNDRVPTQTTPGSHLPSTPLRVPRPSSAKLSESEGPGTGEDTSREYTRVIPFTVEEYPVYTPQGLS